MKFDTCIYNHSRTRSFFIRLLHYIAHKNFVGPTQLLDSVRLTLQENKISDEELKNLSIRIAAAALVIEKILKKNHD